MDDARWFGAVLTLSGIALLVFAIRKYWSSRNKLYRYRADEPTERARAILRNLRWERRQTSKRELEASPWAGLFVVRSEREEESTQREVAAHALWLIFKTLFV